MKPKNSLFDKYRGPIKNLSVLWVFTLVGAVFSFITQVVLSRGLDITQYGYFSAAYSMVVLFTPLALFGMAPYWLKLFGKNGWGAVKLVPSSLKFVTFTSIITLTLFLLWAYLGPHSPEFSSLLKVMSIILFSQVLIELLSTKYQLEESYFSLAVWQFLLGALKLVFVSATIYISVQAIPSQVIGTGYAVITFMLSVYAFFKIRGISNGGIALAGHVRANKDKNTILKPNYFKETWPFALSGVFYFIYFQSDIILLSYLDSPESSAIYNVAFIIISSALLFPKILYQKFLLPKIHRWSHHDKLKFYKVYAIGNKYMFILGVVSMCLLLLLSNELVSFIFGDTYKGAVSILMILSVTIVFRFTAASVGSVLVTQNNMTIKVILMGIVAVVNIVLNIIFIPRYGPTGAAIATVISDGLLLCLYFYAVNKYVFNNDFHQK